MKPVSLAAAQHLATKLKQAGIQNPQVLKAVASTPRDWFVDPALVSRAFDNTALPIGQGQTISQPYTVARMTEILLHENPQTVLEIGTGSGYQAAILASLVPKLFTVERIKSLQIQARQRLKRLNLHNVAFKYGDGWQGWANRGPFDAIMVTAAAAVIPEALLAQLALNGRLLLPIGKDEQHLLLIRRTAEGFVQQRIEAVKFVPLVAGSLA
ncbi:MAG: protein-L-isoaspartate(D-aspartate) O-methyltransferase [Shewanella sp.]|uniref:protein-L-isoaspartate(D-aspartate) O-methyltransferase n=1 Tax=Shewanella sp. SNU WT4 TaxID=2590015 RepID=UPI0011261DF8|nr:protein-L-isoaspartate(D-aspartate) O-methyltransferase [Shewanella sp. SNU WT4]QDF67819.1 protein-L-isoaspartate(D-aspartate) O-methyltransferase [Shewanella sp. SNU WT4]